MKSLCDFLFSLENFTNESRHEKLEMNEPGLDRRSLTPCLDENDENCCLESSKEIELSDISDIEIEEDENWQESNKAKNDERRDGTKANGNESKESSFKKITRNTRGRNYRDNIRRKSETGNFQQHRQQTTHHQPYRRFDNKRRDMERYNVRNVVASREFTISRSRSRSPRIDSVGSRNHRSRSFSPKQRRKKSLSPAYYGSNRYKSSPRKYSPFSSKHSRSPSLDRYRYKRSPSPELPPRRSRSRNKADKTRELKFKFISIFVLNFTKSSGSTEKSSKRKKHKVKEQPRKHKKSRSKSKLRISSSPSISPEPARSVTSQSRQIMNVVSANLPQENIKVILKNEDAIAKRQKLKKREKKNKKEKVPRKEVVEKPTKDVKEVSKEVFASGDNILISVCFNNNNNNNKEDQTVVNEKLGPIKSKSKKRQASPPVSSVSSTSFEESERRQRKHKRKKVKNKRERVASKAPETPPIAQSKRKSDMKPIAIIDLEKSPGKEITQSPKEVIVLSDSDGDGKKRDNSSKDVIIIDDVIIEKNNRKQPETPPAPTQPVLKFALKSKSNILPFNLLHDQAEEVEEQEGGGSNGDAAKNNQQKEPSEMANNSMDDKSSNQRDAYDPFEPTKSGSASPVTPPPPNDVSSSSDMMKNKLESPKDKIQTPAKELQQMPAISVEEHLISSSMWSRKEFDKKQPTTPPLPPTFNIFSGSSTQTAKQQALYDGIYGNDLKTPVLPSPVTKGALKATHDEKNNEDDRTPYSPSSDGYDFEPPPAANNDTQDKDPGSGSSYTFSSNDDVQQQPKSGPLKLTASTLKTFNAMRSTGPVGLQFVNKTELSIFENYLPASQQKSPLVKRQSGFLRSKISRFTNSLNENGSPAMARGSMNYHETLKPPVIGEFLT